MPLPLPRSPLPHPRPGAAGMSEDDPALWLPKGPPPHPARREAAIAAALRRFDGESEAAGAAAPRWRARMPQPRIGVMVSAALVALLAVPALWLSGGPFPDAPQRAEAPDPLPAPREIAAAAPAPVPPPAAAAPRTPPPQPADAPEPAPPPALMAAEAPAPVPEAEVAVHAKRTPQIAMSSPQAVTVISGDGIGDDSGSDVVVTGTRRSRPIPRGDWNACTVDDPRRALERCKRQVNPGAKGDAGRAAAHHAEGLALAWDGDFEGAIEAFDAAIAIAPRQPLALLNRGLAYGHKGEVDQAIASLDQAIRQAPQAARGYYQRSLLLRAKGERRRADRDLARAVELDPGYAAVER